MSRRKISYVDASKALAESANRREQTRLEAVQKAIEERENTRTMIENAIDRRLQNERHKSLLMEAARDDNLAKALKAIYITALNPNALTEMNLQYAEGIVDNYIKENGGATSILNGVKNHTYFLSRLTKIVEDAAKHDVHDIENFDRNLEKEMEVENTEPIPEKKNDVHEIKPEVKSDATTGAKEGTKHEPYEKTPFKDFKPAGEDGNLQKANESAPDVTDQIGEDKEAVSEAAEEWSLDDELFDESFLLEADEENTDNSSKSETEDKSKDKTDDDDSDIDVKSNGGDVTIKIDNSDKSTDKKEDKSDDEEKKDEETSEDSSEEEKEDSEGTEDGEGSEDTEIEDTDTSDDSDDVDEELEIDTDDIDDDGVEDKEEIDNTEEEVEDTETETSDDVEDVDTEDLDDLDDNGESDAEEDEEVEDVDTEAEVDDSESAAEDDDVNDVVGDDLDDSDIDTDDSIDGTDEKGQLFKDLEDEPDVKKAIEIIRDRISDAEETFIKNNAKDKAKISELIDKISDNVKTVQDAGEDSKEGKIAQESAQCLDRMRKDLQAGRPVQSIFEIITRKLNGSMLKNRQVLESYIDEDTGALDEGLVIESARVVYGWLETVNTLQLEDVNEDFVENVIAQI